VNPKGKGLTREEEGFIKAKKQPQCDAQEKSGGRVWKNGTHAYSSARKTIEAIGLAGQKCAKKGRKETGISGGENRGYARKRYARREKKECHA